MRRGPSFSTAVRSRCDVAPASGMLRGQDATWPQLQECGDAEIRRRHSFGSAVRSTVLTAFASIDQRLYISSQVQFIKKLSTFTGYLFLAFVSIESIVSVDC